MANKVVSLPHRDRIYGVVYYIDVILPNNFLQGRSIDLRKRQILVDWLLHVKIRFNLLEETHYLAIHMLDLCLNSMDGVTKDNLQLLGVTCLFIATKFEETTVPNISDFVYVADRTFKESDILITEKRVLQHCLVSNRHSLAQPCPIHFLRRFRFYLSYPYEVNNFSNYLCGVSTLIYELMTECPSIIAAASLYLAAIVYNKPPPSDERLANTFFVDSKKVLKMARNFVRPAIHFMDPNEKLYALHEIYGKSFEFGNVQKQRLLDFFWRKMTY